MLPFLENVSHELIIYYFVVRVRLSWHEVAWIFGRRCHSMGTDVLQLRAMPVNGLF